MCILPVQIIWIISNFGYQNRIITFGSSYYIQYECDGMEYFTGLLFVVTIVYSVLYIFIRANT